MVSVQGKERPQAGSREFWVNPRAAGYRPLADEQRPGHRLFSENKKYRRRSVLLLVLVAFILLALASMVVADQKTAKNGESLEYAANGMPEPQAFKDAGENYQSKFKRKEGRVDETHKSSTTDNRTNQQDTFTKKENILSHKSKKNSAVVIPSIIQAIKKRQAKIAMKNKASGDSDRINQMFFKQKRSTRFER